MNLTEAFKNLQANSLHSETIYAKLLTECNELTLTYSKGEESYTDGHNIIIAPCLLKLASDKSIIKRTLQYLNWDKFKPEYLELDTEDALFIIAHALLIHECFHICYSTFPPLASSDKTLSPAEQKLAGAISNIIEDAYIEALGCSYYNNVQYYLRFTRTAIALYGNKHRSPVKTAKQLEKLLIDQGASVSSSAYTSSLTNAQRLTSYINYVTEAVLFPLSNAQLEPELRELVDRTLPLFYKGSMQGTNSKRYAYAKRILKIIKEYISLDELPISELLNEAVENSGFPMPGHQSHDKQSQSEKDEGSGHGDSLENQSESVDLTPTKSLFGKADSYAEKSDSKDISDALPASQKGRSESMTTGEKAALQDFLGKLDKELKENKNGEITELATPGFSRLLRGGDYGNPNHQNIKVLEEHYTPLKAHRLPYEEIVKTHQGTIKKYRSRFRELIQARTQALEGGYRLGLGIDSNRLVDVKKRYWTRRCEDRNTPELAVEIIIDGSGSMSGSKTRNANEAAIIMHEVLSACSIPHCITQHYAHFSGPQHYQQVLVDYNSRPNDKYNLMRISANEDNRDGMALLWAERHIRQRNEENKVIIIISDGQPYHGYDSYNSEIAEQDTKECARLINKRGVKVIAVAIEENGSRIYNALKPLYDNIVSCNQMQQLPQKLGEIITNLLKG